MNLISSSRVSEHLNRHTDKQTQTNNQAVKEDEAVRAQQLALQQALEGDTLQRSERTKQNRAALLARIQAKREPKKDEFFARTEQDLKLLQSHSPDCVAEAAAPTMFPVRRE